MAKKRQKLILGKATTRRVSQREADVIRKSSAQQARKGGQSAAESREIERERRKKDRRKEEPKRTVLPTIEAKPKEKTGIARDIEAAEELIEAGPLGDKSLAARAGLILSITPGEGFFGLIGKGLGAFKKITLAKTIVTGHKVGLKTAEKIVRAFQTNAKTIKMSDSILRGVLKQFGKPVAIAGAIGAIIGSYPWAEWAQGEAREVMGFAVVNALKTDNPEIIQEARAAQDELWDQNVWEGLARLIPGANIAVGFWNKYKALRAQAAVNDKIMADRITQIETGESEDEKWERVREEEAAADKAAIDYYNEQRKQMVDWEREAEKAARDEDAAFWRKEKEKQAKLEAEDRQAIADFWLAYRKESLKIANDNRPSNLNFGLL